MPIEDVEENKAQTCKIWLLAKVQGLEKFFTVIPFKVSSCCKINSISEF